MRVNTSATGAPEGPETPAGAIVSVVWRLEGAGRVVGGLLPRGHPEGGVLGKRFVCGEQVWAAEMHPWEQEISAEASLVEPGPPASPARIVVHGPGGDITGYLDQPDLPSGRLARFTTGLRRDARRVRVRVGGRVWWVRATHMFGVRVTRDSDVLVYATHGRHAEFGAGADQLDVSVVLLTLASIPSSAYAPILGF
ncbi:hypothetical protein ACG83_23555 [Frankia sp. R43]|uniref:hypothetical protein n=1 Tax=Frankia sp. R43 TaxID=269536 RepID=UPI0006CA1CCA|nr:hypothetical protein [Frankia sp. R43]KPM53610.1 hypothetical protein ACG83_23555 [Frankia sp. R43]